MSFIVDDLRFESEDPKQQKEEIERWARELVEKLNYTLNNLDETNFNGKLSGYIAGKEIPEAVKKEMDSRLEQLREMIIAKAK